MPVLKVALILALVCSVLAIIAVLPANAQGFGIAGQGMTSEIIEASNAHAVSRTAPSLGALSHQGKAKTLSIQLTPDINPRYVTIMVGIAYGDDAYNINKVLTRPGVYKYSQNIPAGVTSLKILAHYPGARVITSQLLGNDASLSHPFIPFFEPLPKVPVKIKFVDTKGRPIINQLVTIAQNLYPWEYFGRHASGTFYIGAIPATAMQMRIVEPSPESTAATTNSDGEIAMQLPSLLDDPYYVRIGKIAEKTIRDIKDIIVFPSRPAGTMLPAMPTAEDDYFEWFATPDTITAERKYENPLIVTMTFYGKLSVKISKEFFAQNGITDEMIKKEQVTILVEQGNGSKGYVVSQRRIGSFRNLLPGNYDLTLRVNETIQGSPVERIIPIQKNIQIKEHEIVRIEK